MINLILWFVGTAVIAVSASWGLGFFGFLASLVIVVLVTVIRADAYNKETQRLIAWFRYDFGFDPPHASMAGVRTGAMIDGFRGGGIAGHLIGAVIDIARHVKEASALTAEQYQRVEAIKARQRWTPGHELFLTFLGLTVSGMGIWFLTALAQP